jgi:hypothetical protein
MPQLSELTDVTLNQTTLNQRPPVLTPQLPPNTSYYKVLYYNDVAQKWNFAVRYALLVFKRRLVTASSALAANINSTLQWGELFVIDGSETAYYVRSNPTTTAGAYNGNNTLIKLAGPGAFVARENDQVVDGKKMFTANLFAGADLTIAGELKPTTYTLDCGAYVGTPINTPAAPGSVTATGGSYSASVSWGASASATVKYYVVQCADSDTSAWRTVSKVAVGSTSVSVTGLRPGSSYKFRIGAEDSQALVTFSAESNTVAVINY